MHKIVIVKEMKMNAQKPSRTKTSSNEAPVIVYSPQPREMTSDEIRAEFRPDTPLKAATQNAATPCSNSASSQKSDKRSSLSKVRRKGEIDPNDYCVEDIIEVIDLEGEGLSAPPLRTHLEKKRDRAEKAKTELIAMVRHVRTAVDGSEQNLKDAMAKTFAAADLLKKMQPIYETATDTGWGKGKMTGVPSFVEFTGDAIDRSPAYVRRLMKCAELDIGSRTLLDGKIVSQTVLLMLVRRTDDPEQRAEALRAFFGAGYGALRAVLPPPQAAVEPTTEPLANEETVAPTATHERKLKKIRTRTPTRSASTAKRPNVDGKRLEIEVGHAAVWRHSGNTFEVELYKLEPGRATIYIRPA